VSTALPAAPHAADVLAAAVAALPDSYLVCDGMGPPVPAAAVPYVVFYFEPGIGEGAPMVPNRELLMGFSVRAVGGTREQSTIAGDRIRAAFDCQVIASTTPRRVYTYQDGRPTPVQRDDSLAPVVLFEHLIMFGLRSDA
jgi:hypothetical protein